jgi:predicted RNase H-like nuclease
VLVAGADGCRAGWVYISARFESDAGLKLVAIAVVPAFENLIEATRECAALAVDIPIGLSDDGRREADFLARRRIGPRRSSVFPAPARCLLACPGAYAEHNALSRQTCGHGISQQTYNILPKIREADTSMTPALQQRVVESHPEVAFWSLNRAQYLEYPKRHSEGRAERLRLLESLYSPSIAQVAPPPGAARDDFYDAAVLAGTAARLASGKALRLPAAPQYDIRGLRMEIVY